MNNSKFKILTLTALSMALLFPAFGNGEVSAQTTRRTTRAQPTATPTPSSIPVVISRADDFPDEEEIFVRVPVRAENQERPVNVDQGGLERPISSPQAVKAPDTPADKEATRRNLLLNLEILTKAEDRLDNLRKQHFGMFEKEGELQAKLAMIENDMRPEAIDRAVAFAGTLRPEELRDNRRRNLTAEKTNIERLLSEVARNKSQLETSIVRAEALVERLRVALESEIEGSLGQVN